MRRFYQLVALVLATVWLPATLCCALEAAGAEVTCANESCHDTTDRSNIDGCSVVEDGRYHPGVAAIKVAPVGLDVPALSMSTLGLRASAHAAEVRHAAELADAERPRDWVPVWSFDRRAAAPAHAPDSLIG